MVIIDTTETTAAAENVLAEFRKITDLPVKTIILTHSHRDHVSGAAVFAAGSDPEILASDISSEDALLGDEVQRPLPGRAGGLHGEAQVALDLLVRQLPGGCHRGIWT